MKPAQPTLTRFQLAAVLGLLAGAGLLGGCGNKPPPAAPAPPARKTEVAATNAQETVTNNAVPGSLSFFEIIPCKGVDPFYPLSTRLCGEPENKSTDKPTGPPPAVHWDLKINAMTVSPRVTLVNINGRSFAQGEIGKVSVPPPPEPPTKTVKIQVLEIQKNRVEIKAEGELGPRWLPWKP